MSKITFSTKITSVVNPAAEVNKVTADNLNEIKASVNALYDEVGVIIYSDTVNDVNNKQILTAGIDNNLTIVDSSPDRTQAPVILGSGNLWAGNKITPIASGDSYLIRLDFIAQIANVDGYFDIKLDINGAIGDILEKVETFPKGANTDHQFSTTSYIFVRDTFFANGGNLQINPSHTMFIWDKIITIHRIYSGR